MCLDAMDRGQKMTTKKKRSEVPHSIAEWSKACNQESTPTPLRQTHFEERSDSMRVEGNQSTGALLLSALSLT